MDYKEIIDKLVRELSYRVGIVNIYNKEHQSIMSEILTEWGDFQRGQTEACAKCNLCWNIELIFPTPC